jgi:hypothetical protein
MGKPPIAHIKLRNFGKTPAYEMTEWAKMGFDQYPLVNGEPPRQQRRLAATSARAWWVAYHASEA